MQQKKFGNGVVTIEKFLSLEACHKLIESSENSGYEEAAINTIHGQEIFKAVRNNDRIFFDDFGLADSLYKRLLNFIPLTIGQWRAKDLNERFRFYRYTEGQYFKWHKDGAYARDLGEQSKLTFMIYLNDDFVGGETNFKDFSVVPVTGMAVIFPHKLVHQGDPIIRGVKYVLRTDVMYERL